MVSVIKQACNSSLRNTSSLCKPGCITPFSVKMLFHFTGEVNNIVWALLGLNLTQGKILDCLFRDRSLWAGGGLCGLYTDCLVDI